MATFTVHARGGYVVDPVEDVVFVRDGFSVAALIFGAAWFLWHRMWLVLIGYIAIVSVVVSLIALGLLHPVGASLLQSLLAVTVGLHATALRRWTVERRGFREIAVVTGQNNDEAELRYFAHAAA